MSKILFCMFIFGGLGSKLTLVYLGPENPLLWIPHLQKILPNYEPGLACATDYSFKTIIHCI